MLNASGCTRGNDARFGAVRQGGELALWRSVGKMGVMFSLRMRRIALLCALAVFLAGRVDGAESKISAEAMRVLQRNCLGCHNAEKHKGGLNLSTREGALKGGDEGPVIAAKK